MSRLRPIAIYLPQFHPIPENDAAWGEGFTEWTNVRNTKPLFWGHYQPHIPHETVGYYDLRDPEVLVRQAAMAEEHGIYGFAYYHYWFNGKRLLNLPIDNMLELGKPAFPFCLIWANENWTKRWDGLDQEIIIKQNYSSDDDLDHIRFLCRNIFPDKRYITIDGKPLFLFYRPELFPDIRQTVNIFRNEARQHGIDLYLCYFENGVANQSPDVLGFDACAEFQPKWSMLPERIRGSVARRVLERLGIRANVFSHHKGIEYSAFSKAMTAAQNNTNYKRFPCVCPMWDNSPRRKTNATVFKSSTPRAYGRWLQSVIETFKPYSTGENLIFINAWNEWAEGNHLEPCKKWGKQYLKQTKKALETA